MLPLLNVAAAAAAARIWIARRKSTHASLCALGLLGMLGLSALASSVQLHISAANYPGGRRMSTMQRLWLDVLRGRLKVPACPGAARRLAELLCRGLLPGVPTVD